MWPDGIIIGVTDHEKVKTHEITLNKLKMAKLCENKFSMAMAWKDHLMGPIPCECYFCWILLFQAKQNKI